MSVPLFEPTVADMRALPLENLLAAAHTPECRGYAMSLLPHLHVRDVTPGLGLLALVLGLHFDPKAPSGPFRGDGGGGQFSPHDLTQEQLQILEQWLPDITNSEIRARIADVLWLTKTGTFHLHGKTAFSAYVDAGESLLNDRQNLWTFARDRFIRAMGLARVLKQETVAEIVGRIVSALDTITDSGIECLSSGHLVSDLIEILIENNSMEDTGKWEPICESLAQSAEIHGGNHNSGSHFFDIARKLWVTAAKLRRIDNARKGLNPDDAETKRFYRRRAESYIIQADMAKAAGDHRVEAAWLSDAVSELKKIGEVARVSALLTRAVEAQRSAPTATISAEMDVTGLDTEGSEHVKGKSLKDALLAFALVAKIPNKASLKKSAMENLSKSVMAKIMGIQVVGRDARIIARYGAIKGAEPSEPDDTALIEYEMRKTAIYDRVCAWTRIEGARTQILLEHHVTMEILLTLATESYLVPPGHEWIFARGLLAGFEGDFIVAAHLLIPQIENGLRTYVHHVFGTILANQDRHGSQMMGLLGAVLSAPELEDVLGEDIIFELRGLLIEKDGPNLRNELFHGLIPADSYGINAAYVWWLSLHLSFLIIVRTRQFMEKMKGEERAGDPEAL